MGGNILEHYSQFCKLKPNVSIDLPIANPLALYRWTAHLSSSFTGIIGWYGMEPANSVLISYCFEPRWRHRFMWFARFILLPKYLIYVLHFLPGCLTFSF